MHLVSRTVISGSVAGVKVDNIGGGVLGGKCGEVWWEERRLRCSFVILSEKKVAKS